MDDKIQTIEKYVQSIKKTQAGHDYIHVDRVRNWAKKIAESEKYANVELAEAAALLHDVGLSKCRERRNHGRLGAKMAKAFLLENKIFSGKECDEVALAIRYHNTRIQGKSKLADILKDADIIDLLGAIGILRGITGNHTLPDYNPENIKDVSFKAKNIFYSPRFDKHLPITNNLMDQMNFQASCVGNLSTDYAKKKAKALVGKMYDFVLEVEKEVNQAQ